MQEAKFIWLNGKLVAWKKAQLHFLTHSLHYGGAVFEGIRCYETKKGPAVFRLKDHVARLFHSARVFHLPLPFSEKKIFDAVLETVKANRLKECYIRPLAYYGYGQMGLNPIGAKVDIGIACWPWGTYLGKEGVEHGIRAKISPWIRPPTNIMPTNAKVSGNYANSILAKVDAIENGFEEAILLDIHGNVAEATGENVFIVKNSELLTAPLDNVLDGITRKSIIEIAKDFGIVCKEKFFSKEELYSADEAFLTGTAAEVTPVREIDNRRIGSGKPGAITKKLQQKFFEVVRGKDKNYEKWLEFVR